MHMCTCTHTRAHTHIHTYTHKYKCTHTHIQMHTHTCTGTHIHACAHTCTCMHMHTDRWTDTHTHAQTHTHMHINTYIHTHTHTHTHTHIPTYTYTYTHAHTYTHTHTFFPSLCTTAIIWSHGPSIMKGTNFKRLLLLCFADAHCQLIFTPKPFLTLITFICTLLFFDWFFSLLCICVSSCHLICWRFSHIQCILLTDWLTDLCLGSLWYNLCTERPPLLLHHLLHVWHCIAPICSETGFSLSVTYLCIAFSDSLLNSFLHTLHSTSLGSSCQCLCCCNRYIPSA